MNQSIVSYAIIEIYEKWILHTKENPNSLLSNEYSKLRTAILDGWLDTRPQEFMLKVTQVTAFENMLMEYNHKKAMESKKEAKKDEKEEVKEEKKEDSEYTECDEYFIPHEDDDRSNSDLAEEIAYFNPDAVNHWVDLLIA
jgi:hypothetical protein